MTFGIAIPTYKEHLCYIEELLNSIESNTILPDMVSISCSSTNLPIKIKKYPFHIIITKNSSNMYAGQNRNIAASKLDTDIISFIDMIVSRGLSLSYISNKLSYYRNG